MPSNDQLAPWGVLVAIKYPRAVEIEGERYGVLTLYADKDYALAILKTLNLVAPNGGNSLVSLKFSVQNVPGAAEVTSKAGMPITLAVKFTNHSTNTVHLALTDPVFDYRFTIWNRWGALLEGGQVVIDRQQTPPARNIIVMLKPNESCDDTIAISDLFLDVDHPDKYTIQVERDLPPELGKGVVLSNTIRVEVFE